MSIANSSYISVRTKTTKMELLFAKLKGASGLGLSLPWDQGCWWGLSWPGPECTHRWPQASLTLPVGHSVTVAACSAAWMCSSVLLSAGVETWRMVCRSVRWHHHTAVMMPPQSWQNVVYLSTWNGKNPIPGLMASLCPTLAKVRLHRFATICTRKPWEFDVSSF